MDTEYYLEGIITTTDKDAVDDILTEECLADITEQINTGDINLIDLSTIGVNDKSVPIGKVLEAEVRTILPRPLEKEVWVKIKLDRPLEINKTLPCLAIAFRAKKFNINKNKIRIIDKIKLIGVFLTDTPANPNTLSTMYYTNTHKL